MNNDKIIEVLEQFFLFYGGELLPVKDPNVIGLLTVGGTHKTYPSYVNALYDWLETLYGEDAGVWTNEIEFIEGLRDQLTSRLSFTLASTGEKVAVYGKGETSVAIMGEDNLFVWEDLRKFTSK